MMHEMADAQGWRRAIAAEVVDRKALDHLIATAQITDVEALEEA